MLYLTCTTITSIDLAHHEVSRAKDWVSVKCGTSFLYICTTIHRYPIFSTKYSVLCKVYTGYHGISETEHGLCAYTVNNPLAKARGFLSVQAHETCSISHT